MNAQDKLDALMRLLSNERDALIAGEYENLPSLASEQNSLLETIAFAELPDHALMALQEEIDKNKRILKSALNGFQITREQITQLLRTRETSVYDQKGSRSTMQRNHARMERKV